MVVFEREIVSACIHLCVCARALVCMQCMRLTLKVLAKVSWKMRIELQMKSSPNLHGLARALTPPSFPAALGRSSASPYVCVRLSGGGFVGGGVGVCRWECVFRHELRSEGT